MGEREGVVISSLGGVNKVQNMFSPCWKVYVLVGLDDMAKIYITIYCRCDIIPISI